MLCTLKNAIKALESFEDFKMRLSKIDKEKRNLFDKEISYYGHVFCYLIFEQEDHEWVLPWYIRSYYDSTKLWEDSSYRVIYMQLLIGETLQAEKRELDEARHRNESKT